MRPRRSSAGISPPSSPRRTKRRTCPAHILRTAAEEGRFESEGWRVRKDGTRFWAQVVVDPIRAEDGTLLGFAKITRDITERREAERALFESEQRFRMLVQGVRDYRDLHARSRRHG